MRERGSRPVKSLDPRPSTLDPHSRLICIKHYSSFPRSSPAIRSSARVCCWPCGPWRASSCWRWLAWRQGWNADTWGYVPILLLIGAIIRWVLPARVRAARAAHPRLRRDDACWRSIAGTWLAAWRAKRCRARSRHWSSRWSSGCLCRASSAPGRSMSSSTGAAILARLHRPRRRAGPAAGRKS